MVWARVRAALIGLAIAVGVVDGLPITEGKGLKRLSPTVRQAAKLGSRVRKTLLTPFRIVGDTFVLRQRWSLFSGAKEERHLLWIEGRRGRRRWTVLYRPHDAEHAWFASGLEYRRVRGAWDAGRRGGGPGYDAFAAWVSERLLRERPELSAVRVRLEEGEILPKAGGFRSRGSFVLERTQKRGDKR
jgi:hypothetical protein